ncbi:MAG: DUF378 domain-containing protein [Candidatus Wildermuthbacteria bacterium]|nr:DUF378 domain-containing protein [Candidatus Wildermuthbacteria bacterium]
MSPLDLATMLLLVAGGLNWGLVGLFNMDLVAVLFGAGSVLAKAVYVLIGLSAAYGVVKMTGKKG